MTSTLVELNTSSDVAGGSQFDFLMIQKKISLLPRNRWWVDGTWWRLRRSWQGTNERSGSLAMSFRGSTQNLVTRQPSCYAVPLLERKRQGTGIYLHQKRCFVCERAISLHSSINGNSSKVVFQSIDARAAGWIWRVRLSTPRLGWDIIVPSPISQQRKVDIQTRRLRV